MIAKIERSEAIPALDQILARATASWWRAATSRSRSATPGAGLQKRMIRMAREMDKVVITATQMMESMIVNPVPTRAEVSDVANAVLDGTDAVMLSAETAAANPVETITQMAAIALEAEPRRRDHGDRLHQQEVRPHRPVDRDGRLFTAHHLGCKAILALTESGSTALWMSRHNVKVPIYGLTSQLVSQRKMTLYRNVRPLLMPPLTDRDQASPPPRSCWWSAARCAWRHLRHHLRRADGPSGGTNMQGVPVC